MGGNDPQRVGSQHVLHRIVHDVPGRQELDARLVQPAFVVGLHESDRHLAGGDEDEYRLRLAVLDALHVGAEFGVLERHPALAHHLASQPGEFLLEGGLGVVSRAVVGDQGVDLPVPLLEGVLRHGDGGLGQRHRHPGEVGRLGGDDRGRRVHDDGRLLRLGHDGGYRQRVGGEAEARDEIDLVLDDQFLCQTLGDFGRGAGGVLDYQLDLVAGDRVSVLLHVGLGAVHDVPPEIGEGARHLDDHADLDGLRGPGLAGGQGEQRAAGDCQAGARGAPKNQRRQTVSIPFHS